MLDRLPLVYGILAGVVALLPGSRARRLGGAGLVLVALGTAAEAVGRAGAPASFSTINGILAAGGILVVLAAIAITFRDGNPPAQPSAAPAVMRGHPGPSGFLLAGLAVAAAAPHLVAIGVGLLLGMVAATRGAVRAEARAWFVPLLSGAVLIGVVLVIMLVILGPLGGRLTGLPAGPFSPPAERLLVGLLAGGIFLLAGLPPLSGAPWRLALVPFAAVLLVRVIAPGFPQGLQEWRPLATLVLTAMFIPAAITRRWTLLAASGGLAALWSGQADGTVAGTILVLSGWIGDQAHELRERRGLALAPGWAGVLFLVPALAALPALTAVLRAEVLLPTLGAFAAMIGLGLGVRRQSGG